MKDISIKTVNVQRVLDYVAKVVAYLALFIMAAYGMRHLLESLQSTASVVITVVSVLALGYIISRK